MSNKTILQNYNSRLSTNYSDLNSILETINNLPSGGEDFTSELNVYEGYLNTQETTIEDIFNALQGKTAGGGTTPNLTNLFDGTKLSFTNSDKVTATNNSITFDNSASSEATYFSSQDIAKLGLKPSTVYSSRCTVIKEQVTSGGGTAGSMEGSLWFQKNSSYSSETKYSVIGNNNKTGVVYSQFITPSDLTGYNYLVNRTTGYCKTIFEDIVLLEGIYDSGNFPV